jgi:Sec-independent protein translocase protein TatA
MIIATSTTRSTQSSSPPHLTMMMPSSVFRPQTRGRRTIHRSSSSSSTRRPFSSPVVVVGRTGRVAESFASTTTNSSTGLHSFFGLGPAEATIILVAGLFVLGPSKLLEYSRGIGEMTGKSIDGVGDEWRDGLSSIPEEFRKGLEEGEIDARGRKAKRMDDVDE